MDVAGLRPQASSSPPSSSPAVLAPAAAVRGEGRCHRVSAIAAESITPIFLKNIHVNPKSRHKQENLKSLACNQTPWRWSSGSQIVVTRQKKKALQFIDGSRDGDKMAIKRAKKKKNFKASRRMKVDVKSDRVLTNLEKYLASLDAQEVHPSIHDLLSILYKCRATKKPALLLRFFTYLRNQGLETHSSLGNYLVLSLVEIGSIQVALEVFDGLHERNECCWNALITYYVKSEDFEQAFVLYTSMQADGSVLPTRHTLVALLKVCAELKDVKRGCKLHKDIQRSRCLAKDNFVASSLIHMYAKCGLMRKAQDVFDKLESSDVVSWNSLIGGYANEGHAIEALHCFGRMMLEQVSPNAVTFVGILKACESAGDIHISYEIHGYITKLGLLHNDILAVGNAVIDMYAKCGWLMNARSVFDSLGARDVISWSSLIAAYANAECNEEALACFQTMQLEGISPNAVTYSSSLKACGNMEAVVLGRQLHMELTCKGFLKEHIIGTALVDMYSKCGYFDIALEMFDKLVAQDVVSWNALISGYVKHNQSAKALHCFKQMEVNGVIPDTITYVCCFKACGRMAAADKGEELYKEIYAKGLLQDDAMIGNALVDMYAKCGLLAEAQDVFDRLLVRNVITWNALIGGYAQLGRSKEALDCLDQMRTHGLRPNIVTLVCCLKACGSTRDVCMGQELHDEISISGLDQDPSVGNALADMYCKFGLLERAQELFDNLLYRDVVSWTSLITGYMEGGYGDKALAAFKQMQHEAVLPDALTFACALRACGVSGDACKGQEIHAQLCGEGLIEEEPVVSTALVDMYVRCGCLAQAHGLFNNLKVRDVVAWNMLIVGYAENGHDRTCLNCFEQMQVEGVAPIASTYALLFKAYSSLRASYMILHFYVDATKRGLDAGVGSVLVNALSKCGLLIEAQGVFDKLLVQDEVVWSTLVTGYTEHEHGEQALDCLHAMEKEGFSLDVVALACGLKACGSIGAGDEGQKLHNQINRKGLLQGDNILGKALVDMYAKCGMIERAREIFDNLQVRDVIAWSTLIAGYAQLGKTEIVAHLLDKMVREGEKPTWVTYLSVLNACCHAGMTYSGQMYLELMLIKHSVVPTLEHYNCVIDLLSRAGQVEEALELAEKFVLDSNNVVWQTVLSACQKGGFTELGEQVYKHTLAMQQRDASSYVCMSNLYADADV